MNNGTNDEELGSLNSEGSNPPLEEKITLFSPQMRACLSATCIFALAGSTIGYSSILASSLINEKREYEIKASKEEASWIVSLMVLVIIPSSLPVGVLSDKIGRRKTFLLSMVPNSIGWILIATSVSLFPIYLGRILTGIAITMVSPVVVYIAEVADPKVRGAFGGMTTTFSSLGMLIAYSLRCLLPWRSVAWISLAIQIIPLLLIVINSPESPEWLISKGRIDEATQNLRKLSSGKVQEVEIRRRIRNIEIKQRSLPTKGTGNRIIQLWNTIRRRDCYKPLIILSFLLLFQSCVGINNITYYTVNIFEELGTHVDPNAIAVPVSAIRTVLSFVSSRFLLDFGRRPILITSCTIMALLIFVSAYVTMLLKQGVELNDGVKLIPTVFVCIYMAVSIPGLLIIPWSMTAEMYPLDVRGFMHGITWSIGHVLMFSALKFHWTVTDFLGGSHGLQFLFGFSNIFAIIFIYLFLPETHEKSPLELQNYYKSNKILYVK